MKYMFLTAMIKSVLKYNRINGKTRRMPRMHRAVTLLPGDRRQMYFISDV